MGDERVFEFEDRGAEFVDFVARTPPPGRLWLGEVDGGGLRLNEFGKQAALMVGLGFTGRGSGRATPSGRRDRGKVRHGRGLA